MEQAAKEDPNQILKGKTCIVTGGTSGIGKETAIGLTRLGGNVTIVGRSIVKCESVRNEIVSKTSNGNIGYEVADLSLMDSVRKLAENLIRNNDHIDLLINNAGSIFSRYVLTKDGFEGTTALNYLSPVLLTRLLFPYLKASGSARIINIGSSVHKSGRTEFDFRYPWKYSAMKAYATSKLMLSMFSYSIARGIGRITMSSILVEPGFVSTNLGKNSGSGILSASFGMLKPFQISASKAAKTPIHLATFGKNEEVNGKCFSRLKEIQTSRISHDEKFQDDLWKMTSNALKLTMEIK
jgi:retinol dehydrogenase-12